MVSHGLIQGSEIDVSAFMVSASGKVRSDDDMCFYGQKSVSDGAVVLSASSPGETVFKVDTTKIPLDIEKVLFVATIYENLATFSKISSIEIDVSGVKGSVPCDNKTETALIVAEIYRHAGSWKVRVVGQGFNGGLPFMAAFLGVSIEDSAPPGALVQNSPGQPSPVLQASAPPINPSIRIDTTRPFNSSANLVLEKRLLDLGKKDPELLSLVKKVQLSLDKKNLLTDKARVVLCLDISGSMSSLYKSGKIDTLVRRVMALGYRFDDDGEIDVFLFGENIYEWGTLDVDGYKSFVSDMRAKHALEGGTKYGRAMESVRNWARLDSRNNIPVYVMFVTDGGTDDKSKTEKMVRESSSEPIFWQFMAIGGGGFFGPARFEFLDKLDDLSGRVVDNANVFKVLDPSSPSDEEMFEMMMREYPAWLRAAAAAGIIRG